MHLLCSMKKSCLFKTQKTEWDVTRELENLVVFRAILRGEHSPRLITSGRYKAINSDHKCAAS